MWLTDAWAESNEEEVAFLHRGDASGGLRRFSAASGHVAQVAHCLVGPKQTPFSFIEVCAASKESIPLVTANTISFDHLPKELQLMPGSSCPFLSSTSMAFLIRLAGEDVAVLIGHWQGFKLPVQGRRGTPGIPGDRARGARGVPGAAS